LRRQHSVVSSPGLTSYNERKTPWYIRDHHQKDGSGFIDHEGDNVLVIDELREGDPFFT